MKTALKILSFVALACTFTAAAAFFGDKLALETAKAWMLGATLLWFATAPFWMETHR